MEWSKVLPDYPRTRHLPWEPNASRDDLIASEDEASCIFNAKSISVEEKVDGANCGIAKFDGQPLIRNRNHFLNKTFSAKTPAKKQFSSIWNWWYENQHKFDRLQGLAGSVSVYGEWLKALHSISYDKLTDLFLAFDLYDYERERFIDPIIARPIMAECGFNLTPQLKSTSFSSVGEIVNLVEQPSSFSSSDKREGVYIKVGDGEFIVNRFKMVRRGFICGEHWNDKEMIKNKLA